MRGEERSHSSGSPLGAELGVGRGGGAVDGRGRPDERGGADDGGGGGAARE